MRGVHSRQGFVRGRGVLHRVADELLEVTRVGGEHRPRGLLEGAGGGCERAPDVGGFHVHFVAASVRLECAGSIGSSSVQDGLQASGAGAVQAMLPMGLAVRWGGLCCRWNLATQAARQQYLWAAAMADVWATAKTRCSW